MGFGILYQVVTFRLATAHKDVIPFTHPRQSFIIHHKVSLETHLQLLHSHDVGGLDVVLILFDLSLQVVQGDLVVLNDEVELELLDTETNSNELVATPDKTVLLDGKNVLLELLHVGLVVWRDISM
jgi:hypothetical protein